MNGIKQCVKDSMNISMNSKIGLNEIMDLQKEHHEIIDSDKETHQVQQTSLAELHRLSITLSNLYDVAPSIVNGITLSTTSEDKANNYRNHSLILIS